MYVSAPCGAGKSHALINYICINFNTTLNMIVVPSVDLAEQYNKNFINCGRVITVVNSKTSKGKVVSTIDREIDRISFLGFGTLCITQSAFDKLSYIKNKKEWNVYIDEVPEKSEVLTELCIPYNTKFITDHFSIESESDKLYKLNLVNTKESKNFNNLNYDSINEIIRPLVDLALNSYDIFVCKYQWDKMIIANDITSDNGIEEVKRNGNPANKLSFISILSPARFNDFNSTTFLSANFNYTILSKLWEKIYGVDFQLNSNLYSKLRYTEYSHDLSKRIKITYLQEARHTISGGKDYNQNTGFTRLEELLTLGFNYLNRDGKPFLYSLNNGVNPNYNEVGNGINIAVKAQGLNCYQHINKSFFAPALNRSPKHIQLLVSLGLDNEFLERERFHELGHQNVMRGSARNPDSTDDIEFVVIDKSTAEHLARLFEGCMIGLIDGGYKKTIAVSKTPEYIKNKAHTYALKKAFEDNKGFVALSEFEDVYQTNHESKIISAMDYKKFLKKMFKNNIVDSKEGVKLYNNAIFSGTHTRKKKDALCSSILTIDIDNGDMTPLRCSSILQEHNIAHIIVNTFSRIGNDVNNYRVFMPLSNAVDTTEYNIIHKHITNLFLLSGYHSDNTVIGLSSGIDTSKVNMSDLFYAPCQQVGYEEFAFFIEYKWDRAINIDRYSIDINYILKEYYKKENKDTIIEPLAFENNDTPVNTNDNNILSKLKTYNFNKFNHMDLGLVAVAMYNSGFTKHDFIDCGRNLVKNRIKFKTNDALEDTWEAWTKYNYPQNIGYLINIIKKATIN